MANLLGKWLLSEPRTLVFYTRTTILLRRFQAAELFSKEARDELFYASLRGGFSIPYPPYTKVQGR